jgi:histone deacetylase complex regulatory component SIN3
VWAKLILAQVYEKEHKTEILEALESEPRELDGMIRHVFERLKRDSNLRALPRLIMRQIVR